MILLYGCFQFFKATLAVFLRGAYFNAGILVPLGKRVLDPDNTFVFVSEVAPKGRRGIFSLPYGTKEGVTGL